MARLSSSAAPLYAAVMARISRSSIRTSPERR